MTTLAAIAPKIVPPPFPSIITPAPPPAPPPQAAAHVATPLLAGSKCLLRPPRPDESALLTELHNDERVSRYMHDFPFDASYWCNGTEPAKLQAGSWVITVAEEVAGFITFLPQLGVFRCNAELGYWVVPAYWGRGIGSEALTLVTRWLWSSRPGLARLYAMVYLANLASQRVASKCGYVCEAVVPNGVIKAGRPATYAIYARYRPQPGTAAGVVPIAEMRSS